mmetsp:Transcript_23169/g.75381  ORF Transcript_23169/g.75381 Transcript_23169/m.75381 type:complete len:319 (-) Transcript_23169:747-1703(-)
MQIPAELTMSAPSTDSCASKKRVTWGPRPIMRNLTSPSTCSFSTLLAAYRCDSWTRKTVTSILDRSCRCSTWRIMFPTGWSRRRSLDKRPILSTVPMLGFHVGYAHCGGGAIDEHPVDQLQRLDLAHDEDGLEGHREPPHVQRRLGPSSAHPPLLALEVELGGMVEEGSHVGRHHDPFQVPHILLSVPPLASHRSHCHHAQVPTVGVSPARPAGVQVTVTRAAMLGVVGCTLEAGQVLPDQLHVKSLGRIRLSHVLSPFQVRFGLLVPAMRRQELPQVHRRLVHPRHEVYLEVGDMAWYLLLCGLNAFGSRQVIQSQL